MVISVSIAIDASGLADVEKGLHLGILLLLYYLVLELYPLSSC
jgi:hypothetical protein